MVTVFVRESSGEHREIQMQRGRGGRDWIVQSQACKQYNHQMDTLISLLLLPTTTLRE